MDEYQREDLIKKVELKEGHRMHVLSDLGIPRSTYYKWRRTYDDDGIIGLARTKPKAKHIWNRLSIDERNSCLLYTSPSPRDRTRSRMPSSA